MSRKSKRILSISDKFNKNLIINVSNLVKFKMLLNNFKTKNFSF
jgi:hypothetical protein